MDDFFPVIPLFFSELLTVCVQKAQTPKRNAAKIDLKTSYFLFLALPSFTLLMECVTLTLTVLNIFSLNKLIELLI